ncbi:GlsB/YeaQ/YmgE family stress response membrane protein [Rhizobium sp. BK251]|uniref:GlsB/YeaQ/YmgE family stress response membrane protein n=1 Tax=Rhizobium sp. BK251 TaxID=2512125 RepID=UPI00104C8EF2|nr:GlsB/YeaQ/YmgE family stress response membrane protein [Rhizobium sp. BK251]TCL70585.1 putative membrane protein YeaQ/YmgE (transglycosylase-associated protein family) [Rhizobium sp. BK251]
MNEGPVGWITAIVVGGIAGWLANKFMHAHAQLLTDVIAGVVGAALLNALAEWMGFDCGGWIEFFVLGFCGTCILLLPVRLIRVRTRPQRPPEDW